MSSSNPRNAMAAASGSSLTSSSTLPNLKKRTVLGELNVNRNVAVASFAPAKPHFANKKKAQTFSIYTDAQPNSENLHPAYSVPSVAAAASSSAVAASCSSTMATSKSTSAFPIFRESEVEKAKFWAADPIAKLPAIHRDHPAPFAIHRDNNREAPRVPLRSLSVVETGRRIEEAEDEEDRPIEMVDASPASSLAPSFSSQSGIDRFSQEAQSSDAGVEDEDDEDDNEMEMGAIAQRTSSSIERVQPVVPSSEGDQPEEEQPLSPEMIGMLDCAEYQDDIVCYLKSVEMKHVPKPNYMAKQPDITYGMRQILVDWLVEVGQEYKLQQETIYLAVNYIDRFLSYMSVQRAKLQLVGTACMFIAAKYEEIYPPDVGEFVYITDDTYSKKQVLRMEHLVLKVLGFDLSVPTTLLFTNLFARMSGAEQEAQFLAQYLSELTLMDGESYLNVRPCVIGAACVALARHNTGAAAWPAWLGDKTGMEVEEFRECIINLDQTFRRARNLPQQAIREKYATDKYMRVSLMDPVAIY